MRTPDILSMAELKLGPTKRLGPTKKDSHETANCVPRRDDHARSRGVSGDHHTVIIPAGATEQHGPHGPLLTDVLIPQEVARRAAPQLGAVVAPPINYALSYPHVGFTGLVHIRIPTFMALIDDLARPSPRSGFKRIVFLNGHYDNTYAIAYACANAAERMPEDARAFPINYWDGLPPEVRENFSGLKNGHACQRRRDVGGARDQPGAGGYGEGERRVPDVPGVHREHGAGAHGVLLHVPGSVYWATKSGTWGDARSANAANRRALHRRRRRSTIAVIENIEKTFAAMPRRP